MTPPLAAEAQPPAGPIAAAIAAAGRVGPYAASDFEVTTGDGAPLTPAAKLYFAKEYIAVPKSGIPVAGVGSGMTAFDDVRGWAAGSIRASDDARPALVWIAAPQLVAGARLAADAKTLQVGGTTIPFALHPKLDLNRSYFDTRSAAFFAERPLTVRGEMRGAAFVGRTLWPDDFRVDPRAPLAPLPQAPSSQAALRDLMRATPDGGARAPFASRVIWERTGSRRGGSDQPVLVVMVNGAQGDDDESWGGHFAIGTGVLPASGRIDDLLINNFYSLDVVSEKGILAAPVPLDNYLADLNSGQAWYRPSLLIIATLSDPRAAMVIQGAFNRVYPQFWRHQLVYQHATMNCASISVDTLRALDWHVPARGASSIPLAWLSIPYALVKDRSVEQARMAYEYLTEDQTRLFPAAAFEEIGADLLRLATNGAAADDGALPRMLADDLTALITVRVPQLPSSRKYGSWPVVSPSEYYGKVPRDPAHAQIVPVPPRPFPSNLRDPDLLAPPSRRSNIALLVWGAAALVLVAFAAWRIARRFLGS